MCGDQRLDIQAAGRPRNEATRRYFMGFAAFRALDLASQAFVHHAKLISVHYVDIWHLSRPHRQCSQLRSNSATMIGRTIEGQAQHVMSAVAVNPNATASVLSVGVVLCPKADVSSLAPAESAVPKRGSCRH